MGIIPKGACIVRGKDALTKGSFSAVKSLCRWFVHAGMRTEALLLAQWRQTARTIGGKCTGNGTWPLFTRERLFREALYSQEGQYLMQASTGSSKTVVCGTDGSVASNGEMGAVCVCSLIM